jgi:ribosomal protein S18 acetylase RimI-like enzyme
MLYVPGVTEDVQAHTRICRDRCEGIVWRPVRGQRVHPLPMDRETRSTCSIVSIQQLPKSQSAFPVALAAVYQEVVQDLGMDETASLAGYTIWLYLRKQRVVGFVATRPVSEAYSLAVGQGDGQQPSSDAFSMTMDLSSHRPSMKKKKVMLGVAILWTHDRFRHQNIATQLVTAARQYSFFGMVVPVDRLAFSTPTQAGFSFAKQYCHGSENVLIYKYQLPKDPAAAGKGGSR